MTEAVCKISGLAWGTVLGLAFGKPFTGTYLYVGIGTGFIYGT